VSLLYLFAESVALFALARVLAGALPHSISRARMDNIRGQQRSPLAPRGSHP
jgi:hypothetical protein